MSKNLRALSARFAKNKTLFQTLTEIVENREAPLERKLTAFADESLISPAALLGSASFYDFLYTQQTPKRAHLCNGTSCQLSGRQAEARAILAQRYTPEEIGQAACLGHCYHGGAYWQEGHTCDTTSGPSEKASAIPFFPVTDSIFNAPLASLDALYQTTRLAADRICDELTASRLRGRGGAGFPFATKLTSCAQADAAQKYIVCNADEGDPGAFSDRYLLEHQPHRVLAGMLAAAEATGANTGYLYIRAEYPQAQQCMAAAISEFEANGVTENGFQFHIVRGAGAYICGEESALLNSIEGLRPEVRLRPPYPAQAGLFGQPTLVSNVETFAAIPWILQHGGAAFAARGTDLATGTKLVCLDAGFKQPGVYEVEMGTALIQLIEERAGGFRQPAKAVQVGGPLGSIVPLERLAGLQLDFESFAQAGFLLGHAGIVAIPRTFPMVDLLRHLFSYMADESCGKCLPCRLGTEKGQHLLQQASAATPLSRQLFDELLETLELGSLCALGGGLPLPVRNILDYFGEELEEYFQP